jgi:hypothetical protein
VVGNARQFGRDHTPFDPWHYLAVLVRKSVSPLATNRPLARSRICFGSSEGWGLEVEAGKVKHVRNFAIDTAISIRRSSLRASSLAEQGQRLAQGQLALRRHVEQAQVRGCGDLAACNSELIADRRQLEPAEHLLEVRGLDDHDQPPPTAASYSASGRRRAAASGTSSGPAAVSAAGAPTDGWKLATPLK